MRWAATLNKLLIGCNKNNKKTDSIEKVNKLVAACTWFARNSSEAEWPKKARAFWALFSIGLLRTNRASIFETGTYQSTTREHFQIGQVLICFKKVD